MEFKKFRDALSYEMKKNGDTSVELEVKSPVDPSYFEDDELHRNYDSLHWLDAGVDYWESMDDISRWDFQAYAYSKDFIYMLFWSYEVGEIVCHSARKNPSSETETETIRL